MNPLDYLARILAAASRWSNATDPHSWVSHAVIATVLTLAIGIPLTVEVGALVAAGFYLLREIEQVWHRWARGEPLNWFDHFMDVAVPAEAVALVAVIGLAL